MITAISEEDIKSVLQEILAERIEFVYLLGSAGTARFRAQSDIDLAVFWKVPPELSELQRIILDLESRFNRNVDLVSLNGSNLIISRQVLETGRLMICNSSDINLNWRVNQLSQYPDFKRSREIIEKNILNRKKYV